MSRVSVEVNGLSLVHEDSGGVSTATLPDVCAVPGLGLVAFPNVARSRDLAGGSSQVRADGNHRVALAGSAFSRSTGDEPGTAGGVTSGVHAAEATFLSHSFDVSFEGRGACRLGDKMLHNRGNTLDCLGVLQDNVAVTGGDDDGDAPKSSPEKRPLWETPLRHPRRGIDSNCRTIHTGYAKKRFTHFVCRYISGHSVKEAKEKGLPITPNNIRLSLYEAKRLGMDLVAIWEESSHPNSDAPNERAIETGSLDAQHHLGYKDGLHAARNLAEAGGGENPIYFTIDFPVTRSVWKETLVDVKTHETITKGDLITNYFQGINRAIGVERTGVYGRFRPVKELFEAGLVRYGWQMTFNHQPYSMAQLHQTSIYPDLQRWGPPLTADQLHGLKDADFAKTLTDDDRSAIAIAYDRYARKLGELWGVSGAGGLDFDRAVMADFGQWRPE